MHTLNVQYEARHGVFGDVGSSPWQRSPSPTVVATAQVAGPAAGSLGATQSRLSFRRSQSVATKQLSLAIARGRQVPSRQRSVGRQSATSGPHFSPGDTRRWQRFATHVAPTSQVEPFVPSQRSPIGVRGTQEPHVPATLSQAPVAHWAEKAQRSPSARVPMNQHGIAVSIVSLHEERSSAAMHSRTLVSVTAAPRALIICLAHGSIARAHASPESVWASIA